MEENRYSRGKIYKIVDNTNGNIYVGSTTEPTLAKRLANHRAKYKCYLDGNSKYISSFKIIENGDYDIVLVENCPCNTKDELHKRERHYIETLECVNKVVVGRTIKEYREVNRDKIKLQKSIKILCPLCNVNIVKRFIQKHEQTLKHQNNLNNTN
jgi:adenylate kinase family enzyme